MTNNSNPFALACRHLLSKYTISTLQSTNIAYNQIVADTYRNFSGFHSKDKQNASDFNMSADRCRRRKVSNLFLNPKELLNFRFFHYDFPLFMPLH